MHSFFLSPTVPPVDEGRCTGYYDLQPLSHRSEVSSSAETVNYGRRAPERVDLTPETICPILVADLWGSPQKRRIFCKYKPRFFWWSWVRFRVRFFFFSASGSRSAEKNLLTGFCQPKMPFFSAVFFCAREQKRRKNFYLLVFVNRKCHFFCRFFCSTELRTN